MKGVSITLSDSQIDGTLQRIRSCQELGFENFDLKVTRAEPVAGIISKLAGTKSRIRSLHLLESEALRRSPDAPAFSRLSSPNEALRKASLARVASVLEGIHSSHLQTIVIDAGVIESPGTRNMEEDLRAALDEEGRDAAALIQRAEEIRTKHSAACLESLLRSLFELQKHLPQLSVSLLTPRCLLGVCFPDELEHVIGDIPSMRRHYWHSTAAARLLQKLGGPSEETWLDRFGSRMHGVYLSDALGAECDQAPGLGEVDFKRVKAYLGSETARVLAVADSAGGSALRFGTEHLERVGIF